MPNGRRWHLSTDDKKLWFFIRRTYFPRSLHPSSTLFRNKRFGLNEMFHCAMTNRTTWWDFLCIKYSKFWSPALKHYVEDKLLISEVCPHWSLQLVTTRSIYFYDLQQVHEMGFFLLLWLLLLMMQCFDKISLAHWWIS